MNVLHSSKSNEWYTPTHIIEAARHIMGGIDLDPASCSLANQTVKATHFYTSGTDGLSNSWFGNVWLNPPYGRERGGVGTWIDKMLHEYQAGNIKRGIALINASTGAKWFKPLWRHPLCFLYGRVKFWRVDGEAHSPTHYSVLVGIGVNVARFEAALKDFGACL